MRWKMVLMVLSGVVALLLVTVLYGSFRWDAGTRALRANLEATREPIEPTRYDARELVGLPDPVQRYFRTVLTDGQPMVTAVWVEHEGTFNMSETGEQWKPFSSTQRVITRRPGFDWEAGIAMMPGLTVRVHDSYVAGSGFLHASLFGLITVMKMEDSPELAEGELMRFFAEAAWYPTVLLPSQGVVWEAVDDSSAQATLKDGSTNLTLLFRFNDEGLIASIRSEARHRIVGEKSIPTPWEGHWRRYESHNGMMVPMDGDVSWMLPEGPKTYWRGRITKLIYEFSP